jgi:hypothetical protein
MEVVPMSQWADDDELMGDLASALAQEADVPPHRREAARAAFAWRSVDEELMALSHDSAEVAGAAVRGPEAQRLLSFECDGLGLEVEVDGPQVLGQVLRLAPVRGQVVMESARDESQTVDTDESGFFAVQARPGPVRFAVTVDDVTRRTEWVVL